MDTTYVPDPNKADGRPVSFGSSGSDGPVAYEALSTAQAGTNTANAAYSMAVTGTNTANTAYALAVIGTNSATTANAAYNLAVIGTNSAATAYAAYDLAVIGTNSAATASDAYVIAVAGTNAAAAAQNGASAAYIMAATGTSTASAAYVIAVAGTNAAAAAQSRADAAFSIAVTGTSVGSNALTVATTGSNLAWSAYVAATSAGTSVIEMIPDWTPILRGAVVQGSNLKAFTKPSGGDANWNNNFASVEGYAGGVRCTFKINSTNSGGYFGLTANAATLASSSDSYYWGITSFGLTYVVGLVGMGSYVGTVDATTVLDITYDAGFVRYWVNGAVVYTVARAATAKLYMLGVLANAAYDGYNCVDFGPSLAAVAYTVATAGSNLALSAVTDTSTSTLTNKTLVDAKIVTAINAQTGTSYTFVLSDNSKLVTFSNGAATTAYVPSYGSVAFPVGTQIDAMQLGAGKVTFAGTNGCVLNSKSGNKALAAQYVGASLIQTSTGSWVLLGDLIA